MEITFLDAKDKNSLFIDIRSAYKYLQGTIPGSINIVENIILLNPEKYLKKENITVAVLANLRNRFTEDELQVIKSDSKVARSWVYEQILKL